MSLAARSDDRSLMRRSVAVVVVAAAVAGQRMATPPSMARTRSRFESKAMRRETRSMTMSMVAILSRASNGETTN